MSNMEYIHAALILHETGKEINKETIVGTLKGAGIAADPAKAEMVAAALQGANIADILKAPTRKKSEVVDVITSAGGKVSETHFCKTGIRSTMVPKVN